MFLFAIAAQMRAAFPDGIDEVHELSFHRTQRTEVMLAFPHLLFVIVRDRFSDPDCAGVRRRRH